MKDSLHVSLRTIHRFLLCLDRKFNSHTSVTNHTHRRLTEIHDMFMTI